AHKCRRRSSHRNTPPFFLVRAPCLYTGLVKFVTEGEAETKRQKAVELFRRIGQDEDAERFEDMTVAEYAEHKGAELLDNPHRRKAMARVSKSKAELQDELDEANDYIEELEAKLDDIAGIAADEDEEGEDGTEEDDQGE